MILYYDLSHSPLPNPRLLDCALRTPAIDQCRRFWFNSWVGKTTGEVVSYPLQYSWASFVAQLVKKPPSMWETWIRSLSWEDPLEKGKATHSSILAWKIPWTV